MSIWPKKFFQIFITPPKKVPSGLFTSKIHSIVHYRLEGLLVSKYISWKEPDHNIKLQYKYQIDVGELFLLQKDKKENKCYVSKPNSIWSIAQCENWRIFLQCEFSRIKKKLWNCPNGTISRFLTKVIFFT